MFSASWDLNRGAGCCFWWSSVGFVMKLVTFSGPGTVEGEYQFPRVATTNCHKFGGLRQQFWRPEVQVQGVGRDSSFCRLRENLFHVSVPAPGESWCSLPCGNLTSISLQFCTVLTWPLLWVFVKSPLPLSLEASVIGFRAHPKSRMILSRDP